MTLLVSILLLIPKDFPLKVFPEDPNLTIVLEMWIFISAMSIIWFYSYHLWYCILFIID